MVDPRRYLAGSIYLVADSRLTLPSGESRLVHDERRPVLVVSDQNEVHGTNAQDARGWPSVLVVPISSSTTYKTRFDVKLAAGCGNLTKKAWARVPALQAIDKAYLEDLLGQVPPDVLDGITAQILDYLGLIQRDVEEEGEVF